MHQQSHVVGAFGLAGLACRVECRDAALWPLLAPAYADFATDAPPRVTLEVRTVPAPPEEVAIRWGAPFARIRARAGALEIEGAGFRGVFDEGTGHGWIEQPLDPALKVHARIKRHAMDRGLICYPAGGTADGNAGDHVLLAPPFIIEEPEIDTLIERLGDAIDAALADARVR